jgi:hypothetical protein
MAIEHVLTCHSVTRLSSIASLSTSGRIFKYRRVLTEVLLSSNKTLQFSSPFSFMKIMHDIMHKKSS